jgi:alpha-ketoglutaric semialdehyde dehydrogenase
VTDAPSFAAQQRLGEEIFGPASVAVRCRSVGELLAAAAALHGSLVATVHATERDLAAHPTLLPLVARKAGRIVLNGVPTGVEVTHAMHHGGPWPATSDARVTSVGTAAILRFARPVCFQDVPDAALPE